MLMHIQSVSEFTRSVKEILETGFRFVHIQGEISNLKVPFSGHHYFILKDAGSQLKAVLFKGQKRYLSENLHDGQQVVCHGKISVFEPRGEYQLVVDTVDFLGTGMLQIQFEKQKQRLAAEGLFDREHKKNLPEFPERILVITSPSGAAVHDFLSICKKRKTSAAIRIFPVRVQGEGAAEEIARAIDRANEEINPDIIVLCRGGGSLEDLWAFNEECVARAVYRSRIPIVTGVGHEVDFTIADFCADFRAPTPTGAAERIIPDNVSLLKTVQKSRERISATIQRKLEYNQKSLDYNRKLLGDLDSVFAFSTLRLDSCLQRFVESMTDMLQRKSITVEHLSERLQRQAPSVKIQFRQQQILFHRQSLVRKMAAILESKSNAFLHGTARLNAVGPLATLVRGYSIVSKFDADRNTYAIVKDSAQVEIDDQLEIRLHRGNIQCSVTAKD